MMTQGISKRTSWGKSRGLDGVLWGSGASSCCVERGAGLLLLPDPPVLSIGWKGFFELWVLRMGASSRAVSGLGGAARSLKQGGQGSGVCVGLALVGVSAVPVSAQILRMMFLRESIH